ncbi:hypothetical protein CEXT_789651 [Caerostris extrusa]|uniref:Uncharacterized protein n=1 Tax=Caerostris extrusa TaxID=172846 RepID=A0AAV4PXA3_CAEEX|nr:hypothetical protein CEXT_789651 [Caerostris extrusa]
MKPILPNPTSTGDGADYRSRENEERPSILLSEAPPFPHPHFCHTLHPRTSGGNETDRYADKRAVNGVPLLLCDLHPIPPHMMVWKKVLSRSFTSSPLPPPLGLSHPACVLFLVGRSSRRGLVLLQIKKITSSNVNAQETVPERSKLPQRLSQAITGDFWGPGAANDEGPASFFLLFYGDDISFA